VKNGAQRAGKLPEACLLGGIKAAFGDEPADNIRLPQRNKTIPLLRRGCFAVRFIGEAVANTVAWAYRHLERINRLRTFRADLR